MCCISFVWAPLRKKRPWLFSYSTPYYLLFLRSILTFLDDVEKAEDDAISEISQVCRIVGDSTRTRFHSGRLRVRQKSRFSRLSFTSLWRSRERTLGVRFNNNRLKRIFCTNGSRNSLKFNWYVPIACHFPSRSLLSDRPKANTANLPIQLRACCSDLDQRNRVGWSKQ